jgi:DNA mismatch endonuclease (patch repair protein)
MARVRGKDTGPEMRVRRLVHEMGYRYRLHRRNLPGVPDLAFSSRRKVIFVHGCWWHGHDCPGGRKRPKTNEGYWLPKLERNRTRDAANQAELRARGWDALVLWECQLKDTAGLRKRIGDFLEGRV